MDDQEYADALRRTMAELTDKFAHPTEIGAPLHSVTAAAVELIVGVDCADVLLISGPADFQSLAATSQLAVDVDGFQQRFGEGPCLDAAAGDAVVRCNYLREDPRWPTFAESAVAAGVLSMMSFQLYTHNARMGALNLFGCQPDVFDPDAEAVGAMLATHAAIALLAHDKEHQFRSALASRDVIGQAKGMIMERFGVDAVRAFELLKILSQNSNTRLADVAAEIVERGQDPRFRPAESSK